MTRIHSTAFVYLRALATVESRTTLVLTHALRTQPRQFMVAIGSTSTARPSSSLASKSLHFCNVRPLNLQPLQHQLQHFDFDLAREGVDFSLWEIEVASCLSQSQYEYIRYMVEDGLNNLAAAGLVSKDASPPQGQGPLFDRAIDTVSADLTTDQQETRIKVVAMYDPGIESDAPTGCRLFFSYPMGKDPTTTFSLLRRKNKRLLTLSKTSPVVDALRGAGTNVPGASNPASTDTVG